MPVAVSNTAADEGVGIPVQAVDGEALQTSQEMGGSSMNLFSRDGSEDEGVDPKQHLADLQVQPEATEKKKKKGTESANNSTATSGGP